MDKYWWIDLIGYIFCLGFFTLMQGVGHFLVNGLSPLTGLPL